MLPNHQIYPPELIKSRTNLRGPEDAEYCCGNWWPHFGRLTGPDLVLFSVPLINRRLVPSLSAAWSDAGSLRAALRVFLPALQGRS